MTRNNIFQLLYLVLYQEYQSYHTTVLRICLRFIPAISFSLNPGNFSAFNFPRNCNHFLRNFLIFFHIYQILDWISISTFACTTVSAILLILVETCTRTFSLVTENISIGCAWVYLTLPQILEVTININNVKVIDRWIK